MREKTKKATFNLHITVLNSVDEVMARGMAPSKNALVEQALIREVKELRRQRRKTLWQEAAKDTLFLADIKQVEEDFLYADAETAGKMDQ